MTARLRAMLLLAFVGVAPSSGAQSWNADSRGLALGGMTARPALATDQGERTIVLPLGLVQVVANYKVFLSSSKDFDPFRVAQYVTHPLHFEIGRGGAEASFMRDFLNGALNPDLRVYRGFESTSTRAARLVNPKWGKTTRLRSIGSAEHSLFVGAGPRLDLGTRLNVDQALTDVFSGVREGVPGRDSFTVSNRLKGQFAAALTMGYRTAFPLGKAGYRGFVGADVSYLLGLRYENADVRLRVDTDSSGLVVGRPTDGSSPFLVERRSSSSGRGRALDLAGGLQAGRWDIELRGDNLVTHIVWRSPTDRVYSLNSLYNANAVVATGRLPGVGAVRVAGEPAYRTLLRYRFVSGLSLLGEIERHAGTSWLRSGFELRRSHFEVRGGLARGSGVLQPSVGVSVPVGSRRWLDLALFTSLWNVERERRLAVGASLRVPVPALIPRLREN